MKAKKVPRETPPFKNQQMFHVKQDVLKMVKSNVSCETLFKYKTTCAINKFVAPTIFLCAQHNIYAYMIMFWRCIVMLNCETIVSFIY